MFERTVATAAQAALAYLSTVATGQFTDVDFTSLASLVGFAALFAVIKAFGAGAMNNTTGASFGTAVPKDTVAAVEAEMEGEYAAEAAAPYDEGTPVDVVPEDGPLHQEPYDRDANVQPVEIDGPVEDDPRDFDNLDHTEKP